MSYQLLEFQRLCGSDKIGYSMLDCSMDAIFKVYFNCVSNLTISKAPTWSIVAKKACAREGLLFPELLVVLSQSDALNINLFAALSDIINQVY